MSNAAVEDEAVPGVEHPAVVEGEEVAFCQPEPHLT
jgi:hypothetical protein